VSARRTLDHVTAFALGWVLTLLGLAVGLVLIVLYEAAR